MQSKLKILFLDDHTGIRDGTGFLLSERNKNFVFFYAASASEGADILSKEKGISIAIIDLKLEDGDGLTALREFRKINPELAAIVFTMYADPIHIETALKLGVQGYITKNAEIEELESAILSVASGGNHYNKAASKIMQLLISGERARNESEKLSYMNYKSLTKSEQEVFALLAEKKEPEEIASILGKKVKTVINQRAIIHQKLYIHDRLDLIEFAKKVGVLF